MWWEVEEGWVCLPVGHPWLLQLALDHPVLLSHAAAWAPTEGCGDSPEEGRPPPTASPLAVSLSLPQLAGPQGRVGLPPTQLWNMSALIHT